MSKILSIHSFRRGTGKSSLTANFALIMAAEGLRVGVVDVNMLSPSLHLLFGLDEDQFQYTLNHFLWEQRPIEEAVYDLTGSLGRPLEGRLFLVPSSSRFGDIARVLREGCDVNLLNHGIQQLATSLDLDALILDTSAGLDETTLLAIAISDILLVILRPDRQDFQGTGIIMDVARELAVPQVMMLVNEAPVAFDPDRVKAQMEETYRCRIGAVLPYLDELMALSSNAIFCVQYPDHPVTAKLKEVVRSFDIPLSARRATDPRPQ